jgi:filamentous hemagglutinin family protein
MRATTISRVLLFAMIPVMTRVTVLANPLGGAVVSGSAAITYGSSTVNINQSSTRSIINWSSFNIAAGQSTSFHFLGAAGAGSAVLNEVSASAGQSFINGLLNSYIGAGTGKVGGSVFVLNPNGILFGAQGSVNVGSFVGTTLSIDNRSFMQGANLTLGGASGGSTAAIQNQGQINALGGDIFLIAQQVENDGSLTANHVGLAAGSYVQLNQAGAPGTERISILAGNPSASAVTGVNNTGTIQAVTAELQAAGGNIYALAINNSGVVRANTLTGHGGHIYLTANGGNINNSGTLSASGASGNGGSVVVAGGDNPATPSTVVNSGTIAAQGNGVAGKGGQATITGDQITLAAGSTVDVSGKAGGGTALIGGGPHGTDSSVQDAQQTTVAPGANIIADAITDGDGGNVVVWSGITSFAGYISAQGGANGGNGGSVEVSGHNLVFGGLVNTLAPKGKPGNLLLDPEDLTVEGGTTLGSTVGANNGFSDGGTTDGTEVSIGDGDINNLLLTTPVTLYANNNIIFQDTVAISDAANNNSLTLHAGNSIFLGNGPGGSSSDTVSISLTGGGGGSFSATFNDGGANPTYRSPGAATFSMTATSSIDAPGGISIQSGTLAADNTGPTSVTANTGAMTLGNLTTSTLMLSSANTISQVSGTSLTVSGTTSATTTTSTTGAGTISLGNTGNSLTGAVTVNSTGANDVSLQDSVGLTVAAPAAWAAV